MSKKIAIDIGGTTIKWAVYENFQKIHSDYTPTNTKLSGSEMLKQALFKPLHKLIKQYDINGIAISTAGVVNLQTGEIVKCGQTMPNYKNTKIQKLFADEFNLPVSVENDSNCNGLAESMNLHKNHTNALVLTLGTGVGGCIILNQEIYHGNNYQAGEIGQIKINNIPVDNIYSTNGLINFVNNHGYNFNNGLEMFEQTQNDENLRKVINEHITNFVNFIENLKWILDFDIVIIGGGISKSTYFINELTNQSKKHNLNITFSEQGNDANFIGALIHFHNEQNNIKN